MNVLILNFILSTAVNGKIIRRPSNNDTMIYNMVRGFVANGHSVTLAASEEFRPLEEEHNDFEIIYFPSRFAKICKPSLLPYPKGFKKYLRRNCDKFDMVLAIEAFSIPTLIASRICPDKMLIWHEVGKYQKFMHKIPAKVWYHVIARLSMGNIPTVAMSAQARDFIRKFMHNVSDKIISHGADSEVFRASQISEDYFVTIAMLIKRKRIDTIITSFADFVNQHPELKTRLKVIGEGPELENLKALATRLNVSDRIDFLGFMRHTEFAPIESKAKAFLVNTASDNNMVSVTEAIANGTPVLMNSVATNSPFVREMNLGIVKDDWNGEDLYDMIVGYDQFHDNCLRARDRFTNRGVATQLIDLFTQA